MIDLPTPETDAVAEKNIYGVACKVDVDFARKLERERDEARHDFEEQSEVVRNLKVALMEVSKLTRILKQERGEAREELAILRSNKMSDPLLETTFKHLIRERDEARADANLITMDESLYVAKCIEVYANITPEGIEDLWPPEIQRIIHEMHEIGERLKGNNSKQSQ